MGEIDCNEWFCFQSLAVRFLCGSVWTVGAFTVGLCCRMFQAYLAVRGKFLALIRVLEMDEMDK